VIVPPFFTLTAAFVDEADGVAVPLELLHAATPMAQAPANTSAASRRPGVSLIIDLPPPTGSGPGSEAQCLMILITT
jgi:hypothetical protein